jgi:hypothetical protein
VCVSVDELQCNVPQYTVHMTDRLTRAFHILRDQLQHSAEVASPWYNRRVKPRTFCTGDLVWAYNPRRVKGRSPKWQSFFKTEAVIVNRLNDVTYVIKGKGLKYQRLFTLTS